MIAISVLASERLAHDPTVTTIDISAQAAVDASLRRGADRKLTDPYLIGLLLFPADPFSVCDRSIENLHHHVSDRIRAMQECALADANDGGRRYQKNTMCGLREAELALSDDRAWATAMERWR